MTAMPRLEPGRIAFIGAGHVGAAAAYAMMLRGLFAEIVLVDSNHDLAIAEASDLSDANALARPARIWAGDYADAATAAIAVISAGAASQGSDSRLTLAGRSAAIVSDCVGQLAAVGFAGILIVASNPVDLMTSLALRHIGLPPGRVIGTGTLLDTSRLQQSLAMRLNIAARSVDGFVIGEHGDSEVVAFSSLRIGGQPLDRVIDDLDTPFDLPAIADEVRCAGYRIIGGKGYTSFGIATAVVGICEAIVRNERAVLPVSTAMTGQFGITDVCLSLPAVLGENGVERILLPDLAEGELAALLASADILRAALAALPPLQSQ